MNASLYLPQPRATALRHDGSGDSFSWRSQRNRSRTVAQEGQSEAELHRVSERIDRQSLIYCVWFFRMLTEKVDRYGEATI